MVKMTTYQITNRMTAETIRIADGRNVTAEYFLSREKDGPDVRLQCANALLASSLYICGRNADYNDTFWKIVRGEVPVESILGELRSDNCCYESGALAKIQTFFRHLGESFWESEIVGLMEALESSQSAYLRKGGNSNLTSGSAFSLCRMLAPKLPYRDVKLTIKTDWLEGV